MSREIYNLNGRRVRAEQHTLEPLVLPFQGEPGISHRNLTTAVEQGPVWALGQGPPASNYGRENPMQDGDWVVRDADSLTGYGIVTNQAFEAGTAADAPAVGAPLPLTKALPPETEAQKRARLEREEQIIKDQVAEAERSAQGLADMNKADTHETVDQKRARLQAELNALG